MVSEIPSVRQLLQPDNGNGNIPIRTHSMVDGGVNKEL